MPRDAKVLPGPWKPRRNIRVELRENRERIRQRIAELREALEALTTPKEPA